MATRLYFRSTDAAVNPPVPSAADWEHVQGGDISFALNIDPGSTALSNFAYTPDAADHITSADSCHWQYISAPLIAQRISGNFKAQLQCFQTNNNDNLQLTIKVYVISNDGTTTKETLRAITRNSTELVTTLANRKFADVSLTAADVEAGDRLVVEIGLGGTITTGAGGTIGHNGSLRFGGDASSGDLPEDDSTIATTFRPWAEFSQTLLFQSNPILLPTQPDFPRTRQRYKGDNRREGWNDSLSWLTSALVPFDPTQSLAALYQAWSGFRMEDKPWLVDAGRIKGNVRKRYSGKAKSRLSQDLLYPGILQALNSYRSADRQKTDVRRLDFPVTDWIGTVVPPPAFDPNTDGWAALANQIRISDNQEFLWWSKDR